MVYLVEQMAVCAQITTDLQAAIESAEVVFIAVGTPPGEDGSADLKYVLQVARLIGQHMSRELVVVTKSTVPVGSAAKVAKEVAKEAKFPFHLCSNPEFLKEGDAVEDFMRPDRVVLGVESPHAKRVMTDLYAPFVRTGKPVLLMDIPSAEMTKYAANGMLATRISFMNEVANLCDKVGANVDFVRRGIGSDSRIGQSFLFPGPGYGGSCFPKDVKALVRMASASAGLAATYVDGLAAQLPCADPAAAGTLIGTVPLTRAGAPVQPYGVKFGGRGLDARLITDLSQRVDETATVLQDAIITPAREGLAIVAAVKATLAALRGVRGLGTRNGRHAEEEDPLFIG
jgi:hypothetical protein